MLSESYNVVHGFLRYKELVFWTIIFPLILYVIFVALFGTSRIVSPTLGVYNADPLKGSGTFGLRLVKTLKGSGLFRLKFYSSYTSLLIAVKTGKVSLGIAIGSNFTESLKSGRAAKVIVLESSDSLWGPYARFLLFGLLNMFENSLRINIANNIPSSCSSSFQLILNPLNITTKSFTPPLLATSGGMRAYQAINMIGLEALFIGLYSGALSINERKRSGTLKIILSSPMNGWELLLADTLGALTLTFFSASAVLIASLALGARYEISIWRALSFLLLSLIALFFTISLGMLIAPLARTPEGAEALVNAIAFPAMFIGGVLIPPSSLPGFLGKFAEKWPLGQALEGARSVLLYGTSPLKAVESSFLAIFLTVVLYLVGGYIYVRLLARASERY